MVRHKKDESGAALVEFALLLPVFMMLVLGMFSGGIVYNQKLDLTHATREGARYGAVVSEATAWSNLGSGGTWASNVRDLVVDRSAGDLSNAQVCVALVSGTVTSSSGVVGNSSAPTSYTGSGPYFTTNAGGTPCFADTGGDTGTRVQVSTSRPGKVEALVFTYNVTLTAKATAHHE